MKRHSTVILFLVALSLGLYVYFIELRGGTQRDQASFDALRIFPDLERGSFRELSLESMDEVPLQIERGEGGWHLVQPLHFPADASVVESLLSALVGLVAAEEIASPQSLAVYGLDEDSARIIGFRSAQAERRLRIGKATPVAGRYYVTRDEEERVYVVSSLRLNAFSRLFDDMRERRALHFDPAAIDSLTVEWRGGAVALALQGERWQITSPIDAPARPGAVERALATLAALRAEAFLDEVSPELTASFEEPELRFQVGRAGGVASAQELSVSRQRVDGRVAAKAAEESLYLFPTTVLNTLPRSLDSFRDLRLAHFPPAAARRLELSYRDAGTVAEVLRLVLHLEQGLWRLDPGASRGISPAAMQEARSEVEEAAQLVALLSTLEADTVFAEEMGSHELASLLLEPARIRLRVWGDEELLADLHMGRTLPSRAGGVLAKTGFTGSIYRIAQETYDPLGAMTAALRQGFAGVGE